MSQVHRRVLVIGASGFLGRQVVHALLADGRTVRCMARNATSVKDLADAGCEIVEGDVLEPASVNRALQSVDAAYISIHTLSHQAESASGQDFMDVEQAGLHNIVAACKTHDVHRLVYVTSIGIAPDAPSSWLRGRWRTEQTLFDSGLDVSVIRPGMIVGLGGQGFNTILRGARNRFAIGLGSAKQRMRTIAVDDLAYYLVGVLDDPRSYGNRYDVGNDDVLTTDQMIDIAAECLGRPHPAKIYVPARLLGLSAPIIERVSKLPRGSLKGLVDSLQVDMTGDPTPIRTILTRSPDSYRQAVQRAAS